MQHLTCVVLLNLAHYYVKDHASCARGQLAPFCLCTSLVPIPMTVVFDLGMRLHVRIPSFAMDSSHRVL